jgi:hypothetical protein
MAKAKKHKQAAMMRGLRQSAQSGYIPLVHRRTGKKEMVSAEELKETSKMPMQFSDEECREMAAGRVGLNLSETNHPFHHKTADGTIVTPDPTLEYFLSRLSKEQRQQFHEVYDPTPEQEAAAPHAVPVDRMYYGYDMYEGLM